MMSDGRDGFGIRLRLLRQWAGLSARGLDRLVGVAQGYAAMIEAGQRRNVGARILEKYCAALGCGMEWLLTGKGNTPFPTGKIARKRKEAKGAA